MISLYALARISVALFAVSVSFPILGGLFVASSPPRWLGMADVVIAAALFGSTAVVVARQRHRVVDHDRLAALRIRGIVVGVVPVLIAAYFVVGSRVDWTVLVIGPCVARMAIAVQPAVPGSRASGQTGLGHLRGHLTSA